MSNNLKTAIYDDHIKLGAKMVNFHNWQMPLYYNSIIKEHLNVRQHLGLFDVSHMGKFLVTGKEGEDFLYWLTSNNIKKLAPNKAQYTLLLNEQGTILDDLTILRIEPNRFILIVNAANLATDLAHIQKQADKYQVKLENISDNFSLIALQGKQSLDLLQKFVDDDLSKMPYYSVITAKSKFNTLTISRLGYTGEDGFEIMVENQQASLIWRELLTEGEKYAIAPVGLAARDTLRLEMGYLLYGQDIDITNNPFSANLRWVTKMDKEDFLGKESLSKNDSFAKKLVGLICLDKGIPRTNYNVYDSIGKDIIGKVTSGNISPILNKGIALAYINVDLAKLGDEVKLDLRGKLVNAKIVRPPFLQIDKPLLRKLS
ncbi:MAG: glycine cleavage system aminomethyltransferase GcvT [SAR324 cluster bacterium]|nr:glycine cleavage system aminomethyltransferase GcvT [SAR324 cluster bacterium]